MTKKELVCEVAQKASMSKKDVAAVVDGVLEVITNELKNGGKVQFLGFGNFEVTERAEREGKNPSTQEKMVIPACKVPKFKPAKALKESVNA